VQSIIKHSDLKKTKKVFMDIFEFMVLVEYDLPTRLCLLFLCLLRFSDLEKQIWDFHEAPH